jgi:hypothetical protein
MLSLKQVKNICLVDDTEGKKCRYITEKDDGVFICLKLSVENKKIIDRQVDCYFKSSYNSKLRNHPPLGDNCAGYNVSLHNEQGYDIKR